MSNNLPQLFQVKESLYNILSIDSDDNPSQNVSVLNQEQNIALSNSVKKEGVTIIQNQNVNFIKKVNINVVNALRKVDKIIEDQTKIEPVVIEAVLESTFR